jgi:hypothetical protein
MALTKLEPYMVDTTETFIFANIAGTASVTTANVVANAAQPNITSVGTLTSLTVQGWATLFQTTEGCELKNGATGTVTHDMSTAGTFYHATIAANFTANFTNVPTTNNRITVASLILSQGATPYIPSAIQIAGAVQTVKWLMNAAPTGTASKFDVISYTFIRTADNWLVFGQYSNYG